MAETFRWLINGTLQTVSPLRVGDGLDEELLKGRDKESPDVATVFRDHHGRAYLPGTTLKGALRDILAAAPDYTREVFGFQQGDEGLGGLVEFWDAFATGDLPAGTPGPSWNPDRLTCISANTTIDRHTKTPAYQKLFHFEYVPEGITFTANFSAKALTVDQVETLLGALAALEDHGTGASGADGWGRLRWTPVKVRRMGPAEVAAWVKAGGGPLDGYWREVTLVPRKVGGRARREVEFTIDLQFDGPFLVNDPSRCGKATEGKTNHAPWLTADGKPHLPVSSLRGALRSQVEKIWRTRHPGQALATVSPRGGEKPLPDVKRIGEVQDLDPVCAMFGAPGWQSTVGIDNMRCTTAGVRFTQDFVAIDRFTGGVAGEAKFNAEAFWRPAFSAKLRVNVERFDALTDAGGREESWMLLAMALRDLAEGDVPLGFGAAKGYGACTANVRLTGGKENLPEGLRAHFEPGFGPAAGAAGNVTSVAAPAWRDQAAGADQFYNPYAFVPAGRAGSTGLTTADLAAGRTGHVTHLRYVNGTYSGRIECRLTAESPFFIGAQPVRGRENEEPKPIANFTLPGSEDPAIPATTLRGMFSAVAEAVSASAMRVLNNPAVYSYRNPAASTGQLEQIPTAAGMICQGQKEGTLVLRPLCLPIFKENPRGNALAAFRTFFPGGPVLRNYLGGDRKPIRDASFLAQWSNYPPGVEGFPLARMQWGSGDSVEPRNLVHYTRSGNIALSQERSADAPGRFGVVRLLGCRSGRQVPANKKHEMFIPMDDVANFDPKKPVAADGRRFVAIPGEVVDRFNRLADEMSDQWKPGEDARPYEPIGTRPSRAVADAEARKLRLQPGDVVFFRIDRGVVSEVSFSQIWRREVVSGDGKRPARAHDFFAQIDPDLLPMNRRRLMDSTGKPRDAKITPAEALFGFVEDQEDESVKQRVKLDRANHALGGRVRFSAGVLEERPRVLLLPEVPLKILSSPKPPSPAMYFRRATPDREYRNYVLKSDLKGGGDCLPKGRKGYLHHRLEGSAAPWVSHNNDGNNQKVRVRPVNTGATFRFHVDFDNLSPEELGLLLYSMRPSAEYRHKMGMAKALGLGTVRVDIGEARQVDRARRYADWASLRAGRWGALDVAVVDRTRWRNPVAEYLGSTRFGGVSYPLVRAMAGTEGEHFKWFVANDAAYGKLVRGRESVNRPVALEPLDDANPRLGALPRHVAERDR